MEFSSVVHYGAWGKNEPTIINEALTMSADWYGAYVEKHTYQHRLFTLDVTVRLAIARYEWLLASARPLIFSRFSNEELYTIALSLHRELAIPNDYSLARTIADDNWILWEKYQQSEHSALINKLLALTPLEDMALRDIIEPYWHCSAPQGEQFPEYIKRERIRLAGTDSQPV